MWLHENDITTVIDLRDECEYKERPCRLEEEEGFVYLHMPVTGGGGVPESPDAVAASYLAMLDDQMDRIVDAVILLPRRKGQDGCGVCGYSEEIGI